MATELKCTGCGGLLGKVFLEQDVEVVITEMKCTACVISQAPIHHALSKRERELRLLGFCPSTTRDTLECTLQNFKASHDPDDPDKQAPLQYSALSYCWGDANKTKEIIVQGKRVPITVNLEQALQAARNRSVQRPRVWADALCINQNDPQERSLEVLRMTDIYKNAQDVLVWLGSMDGHEMNTSLRCIEAFQKNEKADSDSSQDLLDETSSALLCIFQHPLWKRRWIIQELTTATNLELFTDSVWLTWKDLEYAYTKCSISEFWLQGHKNAASSFQQVLDWREQFHREDLPSLKDAIVSSRHHLSSEPRDRIYALLGFTNDGLSLVGSPDYGRAVSQVCQDLTRAYINQNKSLDIILSDVRSRNTENSLATWSPDWCSAVLSLKDIQDYKDKSPIQPHIYPFQRDYQVRNDKLLPVPGHYLGRVIATTTTFDGRLGETQRLSETPISCSTPCSGKQYYSSTRNVARALVKLLMMTPDNSTFAYEWVQHIFLSRCLAIKAQDLPSDSPLERFRTWTQANKTFTVDGHPIDHLLCYALCPVSFFVYVAASILLALVCVFGLVAPFTLRRFDIVLIPVPIFVGFALLIILCGVCVITQAIWNLCKPHGYGTVKLGERFEEPGCLVVLNTGALAVACRYAQLGDDLFLLANCSRQVILRENLMDNHIRYAVIGGARIVFNNTDEEKYGERVGLKGYVDNWTWKGFRPSRSRRFTLLQEYQIAYQQLFETITLI